MMKSTVEEPQNSSSCFHPSMRLAVVRPKTILLSESSSINCKADDLSSQALTSSESVILNLISVSCWIAGITFPMLWTSSFSPVAKEDTFALGLKQEEDEPRHN